LEKQFFKHLETRVLPLLGKVDGAYTFVNKAGNKIPTPLLDYHLAGSWFTPDRVQKILDRFGEIMKHEKLNKLAKAEPKFQFTASNITLGNAIPAIIQAVE
jgi:hypothetical protein